MAKRRSPGSVNFVPALAFHFCLALPATFTKPGDHLLAEPCTSYLLFQEQDVSKGEGAEEGEQITDEVASVKKEIIADEIADEMIEDEFAGTAEAPEKVPKGKKEQEQKDSVEKQGSAKF